MSRKRARDSFKEFALVLGDSMKMLEDLYENKRRVTGVTTGYKDLDERTCGLQKSDLIVIAGRPHMGKTALALNIVRNFTKEVNEAVVAVFSLEMSAEQIVLRLLSAEARVSRNKMRTGWINRNERSALAQASGNLYKRRIHIDDTPGLTAKEIRRKARRLQAEKGRLDLIVIDHLQLMDSRGKGGASITGSLKRLAKELNAPVVALSQLSRKVKDPAGSKRPQLSGLREYGSLERDADLALLVHREGYYQKGELEEDNTAEIIIAKQRYGPLGSIRRGPGDENLRPRRRGPLHSGRAGKTGLNPKGSQALLPPAGEGLSILSQAAFWDSSLPVTKKIVSSATPKVEPSGRPFSSLQAMASDPAESAASRYRSCMRIARMDFMDYPPCGRWPRPAPPGGRGLNRFIILQESLLTL